MIVTPGILASLQRSVHSLLIKRVVHPDFMSHGVPVTCLVDSFPLVKPVYSANVQWIKLSLQVTRDQERVPLDLWTLSNISPAAGVILEGLST